MLSNVLKYSWQVVVFVSHEVSRPKSKKKRKEPGATLPCNRNTLYAFEARFHDRNKL